MMKTKTISPNEVRIGIIGMGGIGRMHANEILQGKVPRCQLVAASDVAIERCDWLPPSVTTFREPADLIKSKLVDAVLISTPHYAHTTVGIAALKAGLHVLVEKPISAHKRDAERLIAAHKRTGQIFAAMFNHRTDPKFQKIREIVKSGQLGKLLRMSWIISDWYRTNAYYASGTWRATWAGEGGGVLVNQCPHNLDLLQWICGMPKQISATCHFGKYHPIEVEDSVTATFQFEGGATGVFVTSTGEAPGTNRFELAGELGKLVMENGRILWTQNKTSCLTFCKESESGFAMPESTTTEIDVPGVAGHHREIKENFVAAILDGTPLIAPAREGIYSLELANAMLHSSVTGRPVTLPLNSKAYERTLKTLIATSAIKVEQPNEKAAKPVMDMTASFPKTNASVLVTA